jgi:hypothetical protein
MGRELRQQPVIGASEEVGHGLEGSGDCEIRALTVSSQTSASRSRGPETTRDILVNLVSVESPGDWPPDVRFTVHASIGLFAGNCNVIRHLFSLRDERVFVDMRLVDFTLLYLHAMIRRIEAREIIFENEIRE